MRGPTLISRPSGRAMGTPYYSSPEQIRGGTGRDLRVDIYAVGVILYELVSGQRPFRGDHLVHLCRSIMNDPPPPLRVFRQDVPEQFERIIRKALAKNPDDRYQTARDMLSALVPFGADPAGRHGPRSDGHAHRGSARAA